MRVSTMRLWGKSCLAILLRNQGSKSYNRKSALRKANDSALDDDPRYQGGKIGRKNMLESSDDEHVRDSDEDEGTEDEGASDMDMAGGDDDHSSLSSSTSENPRDQALSDAFDSDANSSKSSTPPDRDQVDREALREMMAASSSSPKQTLTASARADISKGRALKRQRSAFDSLLNTRIKMQKALTASNTISTSSPAATPTNGSAPSDNVTAIKAAEDAALKLWNGLNDLRSSLQTSDSAHFTSPSAPSTATEMWSRMQRNESSMLLQRKGTLDKWSRKTAPPAPSTNSKFSREVQRPLVDVLDAQLQGSNMDRLMAKSRITRKFEATGNEDELVYDDTDFYTGLLRDLVQGRMEGTNPASGMNGNGDVDLMGELGRGKHKVKKAVDTKASKGRKMRYQVHEKLVSFMAAEDRGRWGQRQREELFAGLLGRSIGLAEDEELDGQNREEDELNGEELRLFG